MACPTVGFWCSGDTLFRRTDACGCCCCCCMACTASVRPLTCCASRSNCSAPTAVVGGGGWETGGEVGARDLAAEAVDRRADALRGGIGQRPSGGRRRGRRKTCPGVVPLSAPLRIRVLRRHSPSSSANPVGAKIHLRRRGWSRGSRGRRRDLQKKSKPEVGLLEEVWKGFGEQLIVVESWLAVELNEHLGRLNR